MKQCPQCNNSCDDNANVCSNCGYIFTPKEFEQNPAFNSNQQNVNQPFNNQPVNNQPMNNQPNFNQPVNNPNYAQNNQYQQNWNNQQPAPQQAKPDGMAIASLVLGIVATISSCCYGLGLIPGIIGIVLGFVANAKENKNAGKGYIIAGLILGFIAVIISLSFIIFLVSNREVFMDAFEKAMNEASRYN